MTPHCTGLLTIFALAMAVAVGGAEERALRGPKAEVTQFVGTTPITISYSSPGVNGRTIWGALLPFGKNWIAGANSKTTITFEEDVKINGNVLAEGVYGFYIFLNSDNDWQLVFSNNSTGNATQYKKTDDVLRIAVRPQDVSHRERLQFGIEDFTDKKPYEANLYLHWEKKKVVVKVQMTGRRKRESGAPEIPENAKAAWAVVQDSLNALVAEDIEKTIQDFADDFETDFGDGGGKAAYAQLMNNLKRGGLLEEMEVDLHDLAIDINGGKAVFKNVEVQAPFATFTLSYGLENRNGRWVVVTLSRS
uniref:DUF2911 domain-containing protein n=1 Tax=uncultured bacterium FLS18 TaxID=654935 RepID=C6G3Z2_9BACT|nr:hypothetical protein RB2501_14459 [uncultured bacterium FLS18]